MLAVSVFVFKVIDVVAFVGLATEPWTTLPASLVISMSAVPVAAEALPRLTMREEMTSVPEVVWKVKAPEVVAEDPGAMVVLEGSEPEVMVVNGAGVAGEPLGTMPTEE